MKIKASFGERVFQVFNYIILGLTAFVCLYPMWHVLMASFSDSAALTAHSGLLFWPIDFSLDAYRRVLSNQNIWTGYLNTIKLLVMGVSTSMVMTILGAYVLSRKDFLLRRPIMLAITFTMFFSGGTIPTYLNIQELGLKGSLWGVVLPFCIATYNMIILRTSFESLPESLLEAARIDGAGQVACLTKIVLPLSKAIIAVNVLFYAVGMWNHYFKSMLYLSSTELQPLQIYLRNILFAAEMVADSGGADSSSGLYLLSEKLKYAVIVFGMLPILCIYPFLQKYFVKGVMIGSIKG